MWAAYYGEWLVFKGQNPLYTDVADKEPRISEKLVISIIQKERQARGMVAADRTKGLANDLFQTVSRLRICFRRC